MWAKMRFPTLPRNRENEPQYPIRLFDVHFVEGIGMIGAYPEYQVWLKWYGPEYTDDPKTSKVESGIWALIESEEKPPSSEKGNYPTKNHNVSNTERQTKSKENKEQVDKDFASTPKEFKKVENFQSNNPELILNQIKSSGITLQSISAKEISAVQNDPNIAQDTSPTLLTIAISSMRKKIEGYAQHAVKNVFTRDDKIFGSLIHDFYGIATMLGSVSIFQRLTEESRKTVRKELENFTELHAELCAFGREATDMDQVRVLQTAEFDKDHKTIQAIELTSETFINTLQIPNFVLAMQELGLLTTFLKDSMSFFQPPFVPSLTLGGSSDVNMPGFAESYNKIAGQINLIAKNLYSDDWKTKKEASRSVLSLLDNIRNVEVINSQTGMVAVQNTGQTVKLLDGLGFKQSVQNKLYDPTLNKLIPKDVKGLASHVFDLNLARTFAGKMIRDIARDILANGIASLVLICCKIILSRTNTATMFKTTEDEYKAIVTTCLRNLFEYRTQIISEVDQGKEITKEGSMIIDKISDDLKDPLTEWHAKAVSRFGEISGKSGTEFEIIKQLKAAENAMGMGISGMIDKMFRSRATNVAKYNAGIEQMIRLFNTFNDPSIFSRINIGTTNISLVSDATVIRIFEFIKRAYSQATTTILGKPRPEYAPAFGRLMHAAKMNTGFVQRLSLINPKLASAFSKISRSKAAAGGGIGSGRAYTTQGRILGFGRNFF